jgi:hypothetical protein
MHKLIAFIVIVIGIVLVGVVSFLLKLRKTRKVNKALSDLMGKGKQIVIQFRDCEIKTREYFDTEPSDSTPSSVEMIDALFDANRPGEGIKKVVSVIIYKYKDPYGKNFEFRSEVIEMPVERLRFLLENQKQATIFVDTGNWNRYYFDLEFLG